MPGLGEYFVLPVAIASWPARAILSGVAKSGSPGAKLITSFPSLFISVARSLIATVLDALILSAVVLTSYRREESLLGEEVAGSGGEGEKAEGGQEDAQAVMARLRYKRFL